MPQDDPGLQELVGDFVTESREHLASVESDLLSLEGGVGAGGEETVNRVFRAVHSVKGVAGFLGLENINKLSHKLESVLDLVRKGRLDMGAELCSVLLFATDALRELIERVGESNSIPIDEPITRLQGFLEAPLMVAAESFAAGAQPTFMVEADAQDWVLALDVVVPRLALALNTNAAGAAEAIGKVGRVVAGATELCLGADGQPSREPVALQIVTRMAPAAVRAQLHLEEKELRVVKQAADSGREAFQVESTVPCPASRAVSVEPMAVAPVSPPAAIDKARPVSGTKRAEAPAADTHNDSIRVSVNLLDRLMNLSGELVLGRNQLLQSHGVGNEQGTTVAAARLSTVVSEMQEAIMQTRMQPIGSLFQRFPRVVRDLSGKLGKRCRLEITGKDVDLDRSIIESLTDPMTHLIRNAVDHGLEQPEQRRVAGKGVEGTIRLLAAQQGGNVRLEISDDGRGINPAVLRQKAVEKGVITEAEARVMSDREAINLIFAPGFSTAEKVTDVSGRGVGMDVVRSNIEKLGGHVEVQSVLGAGTTLAITIPLTLAILPAMVITCGPRRYVLAQANVAELVRVRGGEGTAQIVNMDGRELLRLRGTVLPLLRLRGVLGEPEETTIGTTIIVVEAAEVRYGLVVDAPPDAEEIVVKPLGRHLKQRNEFAGATILGDGRVAMILDAAGIAESANLTATEHPEAKKTDEAAVAKDKERAELVLFRNHAEETFAVPLGLVDRIQRIERSALREVGGSTIFADGERVLPIVMLERIVQARPAEVGARVSVLVMRIGTQQFGLVAPSIEDIRAVAFKIDDRTLSECGVLGSFQLEERTVRLLDPSAIARVALPRLFAEVPPAQAAHSENVAHGPTRVLFAEDTKFFREHVTRTLAAAGFEVVGTADGELAWQQLEAAAKPFDIVVTDVQMPNCDGLELTRRIRRTEAYRHLPVVALTSLSSNEDEAEGRAAGVSAYLVKLDDAALVSAVREHAGVKA